MGRHPPLRKSKLRIILPLLALALLILVRIPLPGNIGAIDFRPYWSSTFLLANHQDFSDQSNMYDIERRLTAWNEPYTMHAWFAPTGNVILLPYILLPFSYAVYYWLLTNIIVVFSSALLTWRDTEFYTWIPLFAAFTFSMTLVSLIAGQVNTLVMLGMALFLFFIDSRREIEAGVSLALTTIKPHLVILSLPLLLLDIVKRRKWRVLLAFTGALLACALILFTLYPDWPSSFWRLVFSGMGTFRETPTLTGVLVHAGDSFWARWIWIVVWLSAMLALWIRSKEWDRRTFVDISILLGLVISPIGWSYDQVMLLFPLLSIIRWVADGVLTKRQSIYIILILAIVDAITYYQRVLVVSEVWYFWVPLVVLVVYIYTRNHRHSFQRAVYNKDM